MSDADIDARLDAMTLEEQVSLLAGKDFWHTVPVARVGVPSIKVSDGPNGARGGGAFVGGVKAAAFPVAIALAATWDPALVGQIGAALALEAKSKGARVLLAPTVNLHRSTLNGRNFECYSEDPFLTAGLAVAYISGLQAHGVAATIKHFIGNESEYQRNTISSDIDERTLRELYMPPFEAAVKRAHTWALMTSYNRLNGTYVSERAELVNGVLKGEWGYDGLVMSDWFGTKATAEALSGGLDLEMPGPGRYRGDKLLAAVRSGACAKSAVREAARRVLRLIERVGGFADPTTPPERADDRPETRALIRRAGADAIVLLKNDGALPLAPAPGMTIAAIGPNAIEARIMGGGSAQLNPHYSVSPYEGLKNALPGVMLAHEAGCANNRLTPPLQGEARAEFFDGPAFEGPVKHTRSANEAFFMFLGAETPDFSPRNFSARLRTSFTAERSGDHAFSLIASGPARLFVDGALVVDASQWRVGEEYFGAACDEVVATRQLAAGVRHEIVAELRMSDVAAAIDLTLLRVGAGRLTGEAEIADAVALAQRSDAALLFVGLNGEWDSEGIDRPHIDLPGRQNELIARVAAVNPKTVVVLQTGCPATMPWLDDVAAVVQAWYPGQEAGNAIADVLLGKSDPGGRLPQTFPRRLEDDPAHINYPGEAGHVRYGEGVFIGYRYYEKKKVAPLFPFGFGLSYATFRAGRLRLSADRLEPGGTLTASIDVTNTGARAGATVMQFYIVDVEASVARPEKELKGFVKLRLDPGETKAATAVFDMRALAFFDVGAKAWVAEAGAFTVLAGFSSSDIVAEATFELSQSWRDDEPARWARKAHPK